LLLVRGGIINLNWYNFEALSWFFLILQQNSAIQSLSCNFCILVFTLPRKSTALCVGYLFNPDVVKLPVAIIPDSLKSTFPYVLIYLRLWLFLELRLNNTCRQCSGNILHGMHCYINLTIDHGNINVFVKIPVIPSS
jgi:hypothetical protein